MKKHIICSIFIFSFIFFNLSSMEEKKRKQPEQDQNKEQECKLQQPSIKRRRTNFPTLKEIASEKFLEVAPEIENIEEVIESIPHEHIKEEIRQIAQRQLPFEPTRLHNAQTPKEVEVYLTLGFDPNIKDRSGKTAINSLIYNEHDNEASHLINLINRKKDGLLNLDISTPDNDGFTPLQRAISHSNLELAKTIIKILQIQTKLSSINNLNNRKESAFTLAIQHLPALVEPLIKLGANVNLTGKPLIYATKENNLNLIELLLNAGANPNTISYSRSPYSGKVTSMISSQAATMAINNNNADALKLLINAGAIIPIGTRNKIMREKDKYPELWKIVNEHIQKQKK